MKAILNQTTKKLYSADTLLCHFEKRLNYSFTEITNDKVVPYTNEPDCTLLFQQYLWLDQPNVLICYHYLLL